MAIKPASLKESIEALGTYTLVKKGSIPTIVNREAFEKQPKEKQEGLFLNLSKRDGVDVLTNTHNIAERTLFPEIAKSFDSEEPGSLGSQLKVSTPADVLSLKEQLDKVAKLLVPRNKELAIMFVHTKAEEAEHQRMKEASDAVEKMKAKVAERQLALLKGDQAAAKPADAKAPAGSYEEAKAKSKALMDQVKNTKKSDRKEAQKNNHKDIMKLLGEQMDLAKKIADKSTKRSAVKETANLKKKELVKEGVRIKAKIDRLEEKGEDAKAVEKKLTSVEKKLKGLGKIKLSKGKKFEVKAKYFAKITPKNAEVSEKEASDSEGSKAKKVEKKEGDSSASEKVSKKKKKAKKKESTSSSSASSSSKPSTSSSSSKSSSKTSSDSSSASD